MPEEERQLSDGEKKLELLLSEAERREKQSRRRAVLYTVIPVIVGLAFLGFSLRKVVQLERRAGGLNSQIESATKELSDKRKELAELEVRAGEAESKLNVTTDTLKEINKNPKNAQQKARHALQVVSVKGPAPRSTPEPAPPPIKTPSLPVVDPDTRPVDYSRVFSSREVTQKARILMKPSAGYTEAARKNRVSGTVQLRVVLTASGEVTDIKVIKGLPDGLSDRAIAAARHIKFEPATKDGRAVSQYVTLEYSFNIY